MDILCCLMVDKHYFYTGFNMSDIIVTLTTVPNRLMEPKDYMGTRLGLKTLVEQSYSNYEIHFNIPHVYKRTGEELHIPDWLYEFQEKHNHLKIFRTDDLGSITKILPTLERISDPETLIIVADDDLYYMDGMIEAHIDARERYPDAAIGFAGMSALDGSCHFCTTVTKDTRVKILEGYKTVSYKRKFFDVEEFKNNFVSKSWNDDHTLSAYMGYKNIQKIVVSHKDDTDFTPRVESFPVISHTPVERGGCWEFRNSLDTETQQQIESNVNEFYRIGYLER